MFNIVRPIILWVYANLPVSYTRNIFTCEQKKLLLCDNVFIGECQCLPGWIGRNCSTPCLIGTFGVGCSQHCKCANGGKCRGSDGHCRCTAGWIGAQCTESKYP